MNDGRHCICFRQTLMRHAVVGEKTFEDEQFRLQILVLIISSPILPPISHTRSVGCPPNVLRTSSFPRLMGQGWSTGNFVDTAKPAKLLKMVGQNLCFCVLLKE